MCATVDNADAARSRGVTGDVGTVGGCTGGFGAARSACPDAGDSGRSGPAAARAVLDRLARIERLEREGAAPAALVHELRLLLREAEDWTATEGGEAGEGAVGRLRSALARDMIGV